MARSEAYFYTYAVFAFKRGESPTRVIVTHNHAEALKAVKESDHGETRIMYGVPVRLHASRREFVCGNVDVLRLLDGKRRKR